MYGAMIGDIIGSKYEFDNIKTKDFPLFSPDCDDIDDSIMTVAVAKAILLRREAQVRGEARPLRETLIETMQDFGRRYPSPKGSYGSHFALWLQAAQPAPYQSYGNGAAMQAVWAQARSYLPAAFTELADAFRDFCHQRAAAYARTGRYTPISDEAQP